MVAEKNINLYSIKKKKMLLKTFLFKENTFIWGIFIWKIWVFLYRKYKLETVLTCFANQICFLYEKSEVHLSNGFVLDCIIALNEGNFFFSNLIDRN